MYLKIGQIDLVPDKYGKHIKITKIGLYTDEGKFEKRVTLDNPLVIGALKTVKFGEDKQNITQADGDYLTEQEQLSKGLF